MISALILAAGASKRMGQPKMLLPWGNDTVLGHVIQVYKKAGVSSILIVTGSEKDKVEQIIKIQGATGVYNPDHARGEMLSSIQAGLRVMRSKVEAALICLGDQPQVEVDTVRLILQKYADETPLLIVPSYQMRRGHPWLVSRSLWKDIFELSPHQSTREFLNSNASKITYLTVDRPSVIQDLDTPEDYARYKMEE